jgi:hypothetical protein
MYTPAKTSSIAPYNFTNLAAALFILLFVYTATSKLMQLEHFETVLETSPLIGIYAKYMSVMLPAIELIAAVLLFLPTTKMTGLVLSLGLMIVFTVYISYMLVFNEHLPCSCGGVIGRLSWKEHLFFNLILIVVAATAVFHNKIFIAINRRSRKPVIE